MAAVLVSSGVTACSGDSGTDSTQTTDTSVSTAGDTSGSDDSKNETPIPKLEVEHVGVDLDSPIAAIALPDGQGLIVSERAGRVRVLDLSGDSPRLSDPAIDISRDVSTQSEQGLLGLALSPDNDRIFLSYTNSAGNTRLDSYNITWRGASVTSGKSPLVIDTTSRTQLLAVDQPYSNHNGGHIEFGPDSMLYLGLGDGGSADDPHGNGQNRSTLLGKLLRLDPDRRPSDGLAPSDNPFVNTDGARPEIWSTGLRNPWRFSFDPANGDLWIADVGQNRVEEINRVSQADGGGKGANFGWDLFEGNDRFADANPAKSPASDGPFTKPVHTYTHGPGCSVTGGVVYRGSIAGLVGRYLYSDYCDGTIRALTPTGADSATDADLGINVDEPAGFATDTDNEVYVISLSKGLFRITAAK